MKFFARKYFNMGLAVIPMEITWSEEKKKWVKIPLVDKWAQWKETAQTEEEFNNQRWDEANGFAVILGKTKDGPYLGVIDYDIKEISEEVKEKGLKILKTFPETKVEKTVSNGLHYIYFSLVSVKERHTEFHDTYGLELFGSGHLVVMAPSKGYSVLKADALTVKDLTSLFLSSIPKKKKKRERRRRKKEEKKEKVRPCVEALLASSTNLPHDHRLIIAFEYLNIGMKLADVVALFNKQKDFDEKTTAKAVKQAIKAEYQPYGEERLKALMTELGLCSPECKEYGKEVEYTPAAVLKDGTICEQGYDGEDVYYIVYNPETKEITTRAHIELEDKVYMPIMNEDVKTGQVLFPVEAIEYETDAKLSKEIRDYLNRWHEQLDPVQRELDVNYIKETWIKDLLPQIGYRRDLAKFGHGKSTFLEVLGSICYRPFNVAGCSTEAAIRRTFHMWKGTAVIDEADFANSDLFAVVIKILNIGFDSKLGYYRCCDDKDPKKVLSFYVYGPKVIGTRERYRDLALESRCLTFFGRMNIHPMPLFRMKRWKAEVMELQGKMLLWRFRNYHKLLEKMDTLEDISSKEKIYGHELDVSSRVKQVVLPLLLITEEKEVIRGLVNFARAFNSNLQNLDEEKGWEEQLELAIQNLQEEGLLKHTKDIKHTIGGGRFYEIYLVDAAESLGIEEVKDRTYWSRGLAKYLRKRTDFPILKGYKNRSYVLIPAFFVESVLKKHASAPYDASDASHASKQTEEKVDWEEEISDSDS